MRFDDQVAEVESQSVAAGLAVAGSVSAVKGFGKVRQVFCGDGGALVTYAEAPVFGRQLATDNGRWRVGGCVA